MRASLDKHLLPYLLLFSSFSPLSSSSSCELQAQFNRNRIYKPGDLVLGAVFDIHLSSVFPDLSFTSEQQDPICYE